MPVIKVLGCVIKKRHDRSKLHKANWKSSGYLVKVRTLVPGYQSFEVRANYCKNMTPSVGLATHG